MRRPAWLDRQVFGWAMFDFANQAFTLVILTALFQIYFIEHVVPPAAPGDFSPGRRLWAVSGIVTQVLIILLGPVLGALADFSGAKKRLLFLTYAGCVVFTVALGLVPPGAAGAGMAMFIAAYLFYAAGENLMGSFLPEIAPHRMMGRVSAFGWTLGYVGGLLCLGGAVAIMALWREPTNYRVVCVWAGVFFLAGALPTFLFLKERKEAEAMPPGHNHLTIGFLRLAQTFRSLRSHRWLFRLIPIVTFYLAGLQIVYWFAGTLTRELFGFTVEKMGLFILQITVTAIAGAVLTGLLQDRVGTRNFILGTLAFWTVTVLVAALATTEWLFWTVGNAIGLGIGALGTSSRAMVGLFSPMHKAAEFFGFYGLAHKLAAILGLGWIVAGELLFSGAFHAVVACSAGFFAAGFVAMLSIDEASGRKEAMRAERAWVRARRPAGGAG